MIGNDIRVLRMFGDLGVRYMTLSHFYNDEWADSSTDKPAHNGLTDFGKDIVREMNRQGIMVDISHVSDKTFYDALEVSKAPLIASHSSCRALCNHPRDMSDDMIKALAAKGGVIQINYEKSFIDQAYKDAYGQSVRRRGGVDEQLKKEVRRRRRVPREERCRRSTEQADGRRQAATRELGTDYRPHRPRRETGRCRSRGTRFRFRRRRHAGGHGRLPHLPRSPKR